MNLVAGLMENWCIDGANLKSMIEGLFYVDLFYAHAAESLQPCLNQWSAALYVDTLETAASGMSLNIKQTQVKPDENGLFTTKLPKTGVTVKLRPLNYGDNIEIEKMELAYPVGRVVPKSTWRLNKQIVEIDGNNNPGDISMFIEQLPIMDSKYIRNFMRDNQPSLDLSRTVIAPSGELVSFEIAFGVEFFRPFF